MNDFTKEELLVMHGWGIDRVEAVGREHFQDEGSVTVYNKLTEMINSYCEHTFDIEYSPHNCCSKCGVKK